ncbi:unnamed protein product, partial [Nesidiocoris tenuis]
MARCMIDDAQLDREFWGEAVQTAMYTINRIPTRTLSKGETPASIWYNRKIDVSNMRVFGCKAHSHIPKEDRSSKLDFRSKQLIFLGYCSNGYRLWDAEKQKIVTSRSVVFDEASTQRPMQLPTLVHPSSEDDETQNSSSEPNSRDDVNDSETAPAGNDETPTVNDANNRKRDRKLPSKYQDYEMDFFAALSCSKLPSEIPTKYQDAVKDEEWKSAVEKELDNMKQNETWEIVPAPVEKPVIDSKWVFREKLIDGLPVKRARLVARGFLEEPSLEDEVYSPVARMNTLRILFALAVEKDLHIHMIDFDAAFLNGTLKNPIYMKLPEGLTGYHRE